MKKLLIVMGILLLTVSVQAKDLTLGWGYDVADEADITEFLMYYADNPDPAAWTLIQIDTIVPTAREQDIVVGDVDCIYLILRAANGSLLSPNSNVVEWCPPPPPPPDPVTPRDFMLK